jgi:putative transcriptional regulator
MNIMIRIKISELLGKKKMTQKALSQLTGIRPATISKMYYEEIKRIEIDQIDKLCDALDCSVEDIFEHTKNKNINELVEKVSPLRGRTLFRVCGVLLHGAAARP